MSLKDIYDSIETMIFSNDIDTIVHHYVNTLNNLEELYKERIEEINNGKTNNLEDRESPR